MAPGLTETATDSQGVHSSLPLNSSDVDPEGSTLAKTLDELVGCSHISWLDINNINFPDACSVSPVHFLPSVFQANELYETGQFLSPESPVNLFSLNTDINAVESFMPFYLLDHDESLASIPNYSNHGVAQGYLSSISQPYECEKPCFHVEKQDLDEMTQAHRMEIGQGKCWQTNTVTSGGPWLLKNPGSKTEEKVAYDQVRTLLSCQQSLVKRATQARRRLQTLLGEYTAKHYSVQLRIKMGGSYGKQLSTGPHTCNDTKPFNKLRQQEEGGFLANHCPTTTPVLCSADIVRFSKHAQAHLHELHKVLDSDITDSSSEEEWEQQDQNTQRSQCEWEYQMERAEICSWWTKLQNRVYELEERIQQLHGLHQQIHSAKGGVVLAEPQPMTKKQKQVLGTVGRSSVSPLSCRLVDSGNFSAKLDAEPSSPMCILRNIERQSARVTKILRCLMPACGLTLPSSPVTMPNCVWQGSKRALTQELEREDGRPQCQGQVMKKKRMSCRRQKPRHVDKTCVCARTRPLLACRKRRLFFLPNTLGPHKEQPTSPLDVSCDPCDPLEVCIEVSCSEEHQMREKKRVGVMPQKPCPMSLVTSAKAPEQSQTTLGTEDCLTPHAAINTVDCRSHCYSGGKNKEPVARSAFKCSQAKKHHQRTAKGRKVCKRYEQESAKNGRTQDAPKNSSSCVKSSFSRTVEYGPQSSGRQQLREQLYNINNIVIPMSLGATTRAETLQYKEILTPSWRVADILPLEDAGGEWDTEVELLSDDAFCQRHQVHEEREKLLWTSCERGQVQKQRSRHTRVSRSSSARLPELRSNWTTQLDEACLVRCTDAEEPWAERTNKSPWEKRLFPLSKDDEDALTPDKNLLSSWETKRKAARRCSTKPSSNDML